ncbi:hypothetical protein L6164_001048 [Bauhinia variegata]|uniref:Uncharacterized protein n=1 Tax=Bauhinia variegata TaxID=167791 RepID=A0ACB9QAJ9_BAUVA|nr:hypothetical protein L6164_001048 [Bauhinia variegata]
MAIVGVSMSFDLAKVPRLVPLHSSSFTRNSAGPKRIRQARCVGGSGRTATISVNARFWSSRGGAGLLERPSLDQSQFEPLTQVQKGGGIGPLNARKRVGSGDSYRVLLIDDIRHTVNLEFLSACSANVLPQVVPSATPVEACKFFHESRENGAAIVIITVKEHAEFYSQMMIRRGLQSTIEPDSSSA